jgi:hypothetical protein
MLSGSCLRMRRRDILISPLGVGKWLTPSVMGPHHYKSASYGHGLNSMCILCPSFSLEFQPSSTCNLEISYKNTQTPFFHEVDLVHFMKERCLCVFIESLFVPSILVQVWIHRVNRRLRTGMVGHSLNKPDNHNSGQQWIICTSVTGHYWADKSQTFRLGID